MFKSLRRKFFGPRPPAPAGTMDLRQLFCEVEETRSKDGARLFRALQYGGIHLGMADVYLSSLPRFTPRTLEFRLRSHGHDVQVVESEPGLWVASFPEIRVSLAGREHPALVRLEMPALNDGQYEDPTQALSGLLPPVSVGDEARHVDAVRKSPYCIRVYEKNALLPPALRLELLSAVVSTVVDAARVGTIYWRSSGCFITPERFAKAAHPFSLSSVFDEVVGIRQMRAPNSAVREYITETRGLFDFGLPDVQIRTGANGTVAAERLVRSVARSMWTYGSLPHAGDRLSVTMDSGSASPLTTIRYEASTLAPFGRVMLSLTPVEALERDESTAASILAPISNLPTFRAPAVVGAADPVPAA